MELTDSRMRLFVEPAHALTGSARRRLMARTVQELGRGGQRRAERDLGGNRQTIRKALRERETGLTCVDGVALRRRKRAEEYLPPCWTTAPPLALVKAKLNPRFGPTAAIRAGRQRTSAANSSGIRATPTPKCRPHAPLLAHGTISGITRRRWPSPTPKTIPPTDASLERVAQVKREADAAPNTLRIAMDAQATVTVGPVARGGKNRVPTSAADHDVQPEAPVTPGGIFRPATDDLLRYGVTAKGTRDGLVDQLIQWGERVRARYAHSTTLVLNLDNGPENHSRRSQFM